MAPIQAKRGLFWGTEPKTDSTGIIASDVEIPIAVPILPGMVFIGSIAWAAAGRPDQPLTIGLKFQVGGSVILVRRSGHGWTAER